MQIISPNKEVDFEQRATKVGEREKKSENI